MRKNVLLTSALTLIAGAVGAVLRYMEMDTVFEAGTGLPIKYAPISLALIGLSVLVIAGAALYALSAGKRLANADLRVSGLLPLALITVCGVIMALGAVGNYVLDTKENDFFRIAYLILGAGSGIAVIVAALNSYGSDSGDHAKLYIIPTLFMCLWLVMTYKDNNVNPALVEYCYMCLAAAGAATAFYYAAGYGYGKKTPKRTVASHLIGAFFCLVAMGSAGNIARAAVYGATAVILLVNLCMYVNSPEEPEPESEPEEIAE